MPTTVLRDEVQRLVNEEGAQLVDVVAEHEYEEEHIAGALNIPLRRLSAQTAGVLDRDRAVVVY